MIKNSFAVYALLFFIKYLLTNLGTANVLYKISKINFDWQYILFSIAYFSFRPLPSIQSTQCCNVLTFLYTYI